MGFADVLRRNKRHGSPQVCSPENKGTAKPGFLRDTSAQAMVEFAIIAPVLFTLIFGVMELALMFNAYQQVHYAAFAAARSAIVYIPVSEPPFSMPQNGGGAPMERAAILAMMPVASPITGVISDGLPGLKGNLANLDEKFAEAMAALGLGGFSAHDLPFVDFFDKLGSFGGDIQSLKDKILGQGPLNGATDMYAGDDLIGDIAGWNPLIAKNAWAAPAPTPPPSPFGWNPYWWGAPDPEPDTMPSTLPGVENYLRDRTTEKISSLNLAELLKHSADKYVTAYLATTARIIDADSKEKTPLPDDHKYSPGEAITVQVTFYYSPKMPVVRKVFWSVYLMARLEPMIRDYLINTMGLGSLPEDKLNELVTAIAKMLSQFIAAVDLPYYPIPIKGDATLQVEGDRWCSASSFDDGIECTPKHGPRQPWEEYYQGRLTPYHDDPPQKRGLGR